MHTLSPKWSRTSCTTWSASLVRASYMTSTMVLSSSGRVQVLLHQLDVAQELAQALQGVVLALDRDQHLGGRGQAVDGQQAERGRAVDEHEVVVVADLVERALAAAARG